MYYHLEFNIIQEHEITSGCGYICACNCKEKRGKGANVLKQYTRTSSKNNLDDATTTELGINFPNEIASFGCTSRTF